MNLKQCPSKKDKRHKIKVKIKLKVKNISFLGCVDENIKGGYICNTDQENLTRFVLSEILQQYNTFAIQEKRSLPNNSLWETREQCECVTVSGLYSPLIRSEC